MTSRVRISYDISSELLNKVHLERLYLRSAFKQLISIVFCMRLYFRILLAEIRYSTTKDGTHTASVTDLQVHLALRLLQFQRLRFHFPQYHINRTRLQAYYVPVDVIVRRLLHIRISVSAAGQRATFIYIVEVLET